MPISKIGLSISPPLQKTGKAGRLYNLRPENPCATIALAKNDLCHKRKG